MEPTHNGTEIQKKDSDGVQHCFLWHQWKESKKRKMNWKIKNKKKFFLDILPKLDNVQMCLWSSHTHTYIWKVWKLNFYDNDDCQRQIIFNRELLITKNLWNNLLFQFRINMCVCVNRMNKRRIIIKVSFRKFFLYLRKKVYFTF